jgi:TP901 family phage tail tape measure protein
MADELKRVGLKLTAEGAVDFKASLKECAAAAKENRSELKLAQSQYDENTTSAQKLADQQKFLASQVDVYSDKVVILKRQLAEMEASEDADAAAIARKRSELNEAQTTLNHYKENLDQVNASIANHEAELDAWSQKLQEVGGKMTDIGQEMNDKLTKPIMNFIDDSVDLTAQFDTSMSKVRAISGTTGEEFDALRSKARDLGKSTVFSATEVADAMGYMGMAGWDASQMMNGVNGVLNLAAASGEDLAQTSDIVTDALTAFGMTAEQSGHFADVLAQVSADANTNVSMLGESFKYAAPVAGAMGYTAEDVSIALGLMANSGIKASQAGTSLRRLMQNLADPSEKTANAMQRLGITLDDGQGNMLSFRQVMDDLRSSMGNMKISGEEVQEGLDMLVTALEQGTISEEDFEGGCNALMEAAYGAEGAMKAQAASAIAGAGGMAGLLAIVSATDEDYQALCDSIDHASDVMVETADGSVMTMNEALASGKEVINEYNGAAEAMSSIMKDNLTGDSKTLESAIQELKISVGDMLMPAIRETTQWLTEVVNKFNSMDEGTKENILNLALLVARIGPLLLGLGKISSVVGKDIIPLLKNIPGVITAIQTGAKGLFALLAANPVVAIIGGIIAAVVLLYNHCKPFHDFVDNSIRSIGEWIRGLGDRVTGFADNVKQKFDDMVSFVKRLVDRLKGFFDFEWHLPHIDLPHFSIEGGFSLNPPSIPHISVDWYKKAYSRAMILDSPTIFGASGGHLLGGGDGSEGEVVAGESRLKQLISDAVGTTITKSATFGNTVFNIYPSAGMDEERLARKIMALMNDDYDQKESVFA